MSTRYPDRPDNLTSCNGFCRRIVPRHRYLQKVHTQKHWPFPMTYLKLTDETFARDVAGRPLHEFVAFRDQVAASVAPSPARSARRVAPARRW